MQSFIMVILKLISKQIDPNFLNELKDKSTVSSTIEFSTMLTGSLTDDTVFIRLKAVDDQYLLYAKVFLNQKMQCKIAN